MPPDLDLVLDLDVDVDISVCRIIEHTPAMDRRDQQAFLEQRGSRSTSKSKHNGWHMITIV